MDFWDGINELGVGGVALSVASSTDDGYGYDRSVHGADSDEPEPDNGIADSQGGR